MQLLVSVRSAEEAETALAGGADIVDAKEPRHGSLGPVAPEVLAGILHRLPSSKPVSIALGDGATIDDVLARISSIPESSQRITYLKLGFAGVPDSRRVGRLLNAARTASPASSTRIVAVGYADAELAGSVPPQAICRAAVRAGIAGILFDTYTKGGGNLLTWMEPAVLTDLLALVREGGLFAAVAGGLGVGDLDTVIRARPDVVGFRGAVCTGGRDGEVSEHRVKQLRKRLDRLNSGFLQVHSKGRVSAGGETPDDPANLFSPVELTH